MTAKGIAFGIMCKAPRAGMSKTRLCPPLTGEEAAALSCCFIADVAAVIAGLRADARAHGVAVYTPPGAESAFDGLLPPGFSLLAQRGDSLEARMVAATGDLFDSGYDGVCLLNSDSPTLPETLLQAASTALTRLGDRLVLGPAMDGGYYLIGLKRPHADLFRDIAWSTGQVLQQTLGAAAALRLPVTLLPTWYDVDDPAGLRCLLHELFGSGTSLAADGLKGSPAPRSRQYLERLLAGPDGARLGFSPAPGDK
jgi:rSAM/selenodomain-associated transferase 1